MSDQFETKIKETNTTMCKGCSILKSRIFVSKYPSGSKKYVNENGQEWSGKTCPDCHKSKTMVNMKKLRRNRKDSSK